MNMILTAPSLPCLPISPNSPHHPQHLPLHRKHPVHHKLLQNTRGTFLKKDHLKDLQVRRLRRIQQSCHSIYNIVLEIRFFELRASDVCEDQVKTVAEKEAFMRVEVREGVEFDVEGMQPFDVHSEAHGVDVGEADLCLRWVLLGDCVAQVVRAMY